MYISFDSESLSVSRFEISCRITYRAVRRRARTSMTRAGSRVVALLLPLLAPVLGAASASSDARPRAKRSLLSVRSELQTQSRWRVRAAPAGLGSSRDRSECRACPGSRARKKFRLHWASFRNKLQHELTPGICLGFLAIPAKCSDRPREK